MAMENNSDTTYSVNDLRDAIVLWHACNLALPPTIETVKQNSDTVAFKVALKDFMHSEDDHD